MAALLELEPLAQEAHALAAPVDGLVGGDAEVGAEVDVAGDVEDDPERAVGAARLAEGAVAVVVEGGDAVERAVEPADGAAAEASAAPASARRVRSASAYGMTGPPPPAAG